MLLTTTSSAEAFVAHLKAPTHHPHVNKPWRI
jgi:hypothetical protein